MKIGKIKEDKGYTITMPLDENMTNGFVEEKLVQHIAYLLLVSKNATIGINPFDKEIYLVGFKYIEPEKARFKNMQTINMQEVLDIYKDEQSLKELDSDLVETTHVAGQVALFVMTYWLRHGTRAFMFIYDSISKELECGLGMVTDFRMVDEISKSIKHYKTDDKGIFLKREWIKREDADKTLGGGKV